MLSHLAVPILNYAQGAEVPSFYQRIAHELYGLALVGTFGYGQLLLQRLFFIGHSGKNRKGNLYSLALLSTGPPDEEAYNFINGYFVGMITSDKSYLSEPIE